MKRFFCLFLCILLPFLSYAQENERVKKHLEEKYGYACYHEYDGIGWYTIRRGDWHTTGNEGACDSEGKETIPPIWDDVSFQGSYYKVKKNGKVCIRDLNNKELLPCTKYTAVWWYQKKDHGGYCEVEIDGKKGVIDKDNNEVIPCLYDDTRYFSLKEQPYCIVELKGKKGVADINGNEIVPCKYEEVYDWQFKDGDYCEVKIGEKTGIANKKGEEIIPVGMYSYITFSAKSRYVIVSKNVECTKNEFGKITKVNATGKWGVFDLNAMKEIIPCKYDFICLEEDGIFAFNLGGHNVIEKKYGMRWDVEGGKWGYVDTNGKEVIPAQYDNVTGFSDGVAQVMKNGVVSMLAHPLKGSSVKMANGGNIIAVDHNIPTMNRDNDNTFAFIVANENYTHFAGADYSINDGKVFADYCKKTLGIPENNVRYYEDATYGNIVSAVKKLRDIADVYEGDAKIIFYYSGLGATDEKSMEKFLLATDASLAALNSTGYSVSELLKVLNSLNVVCNWVILDAPFSNVDKNGNTLTEARGVALKAKAIVPNGNVIISQACDDMQVAYSSKQLGHGIFTYGLLEKLQQTKGECTIKEMTKYATDWVKKYAMSKFDKMQTPVTNVSEKLDYIDNIKLY